MKKLSLSLLGILCATSLVACGSEAATSDATEAPAAETTEVASTFDASSLDPASDAGTIFSNGTLVIGITIYEPMNYEDENGVLTGFDTEFAEALCDRLGLTAQFQEIDWEMKETELKSMNIDCIWNGLTVTEDRKENMDFSTPYLTNKQCVVVNTADGYTDSASLAGAILSAESGSAGETAIMADANLSQGTYTASTSQQDALIALKAGNVDAIVIDYTMATASVGSGDYADMEILDVELENELYAIGFRTGSNMTAIVNQTIDELIADGTLAALAEKYDMTELYEAAIN